MLHARRLQTMVLIVLPLLASACGGDTNDDAAQSPRDLSFTEIYSGVLFKRCAGAGCHGAGGGGAGMMDLSTREKAYVALVDVPAAGPECASSALVRVEPRNPDASLLHDKLSAQPSCGERMPLGGSLDATTRAEIDAWIRKGAPND